MTVLTVKGVRYDFRFPIETVAETFRRHLHAPVRVHVETDRSRDVEIHISAPHTAVLAAARTYLDPLAVEWSHDGGETP